MPKKPLFTKEEYDEMGAAAYASWDYIAYDCLTALAEEKGVSVDAVTMSRNHVLEVALDAGRFEEHLRRNLRAHNPHNLDVEDLLKRYDALSYPRGKFAAVKSHFPYTRYGT